MFTPKTALFTFVASCALAMGACQPAEGPAERAAKTGEVAAGKPADADAVAKAPVKVEDVARDTKDTSSKKTP